jgi:biopolymer transport protein ExbD
MAMHARTADGELANDINTTPLIDVMLVLLTLLILTLPPQTHALKIDMPRNAPTQTPPVQAVDLRVDFDGLVYWNGKVVDRATLDSYFRQSLNRMPQPEIHLIPDALAKYDIVAQVLGDAQRIGITKIGFANVSEY